MESLERGLKRNVFIKRNYIDWKLVVEYRIKEEVIIWEVFVDFRNICRDVLKCFFLSFIIVLRCGELKEFLRLYGELVYGDIIGCKFNFVVFRIFVRGVCFGF